MEKGDAKWVGKSVKRLEDRRLLTGTGAYLDDLKISHLEHAAILRSPYAHARIRAVDVSRALELPGVVGCLTGEDAARMSNPFGLGVNAPVKYYSLAVDKARFVGEPVALVVAKDRYIAEDALDLIAVDYEPLEAVVDVEKAIEPGAPRLHEMVPDNISSHRLLRYGDVERLFKESDFIVKEKFFFPKYSSTPMETFAVVADYNPATGVLTIWSNFQGPFIMHPVVAKALNLDENKLRFLVPADNGGGFGIKTSIYPYLTLIALAAIKTGARVKWIEDRREHLLASSSGADRVAHMEAAVKRDGRIMALRQKIYDNVGGYLRTPEPACLYARTGNLVGSYRIEGVEVDGYAVMTNKSPTGPNRGYGCQQLYFCLERMVDLIAERAGLDPAEVRLKNFIHADQMPYTTPTGGIYDSGDYKLAFEKALELADYGNLRQQQKRARQQGKYFGIGLATVVDPSVTNIAYITVAWTPEERARQGYLPKSGSGETGLVRIDPLGKITALVNTTPEGQGHETVVAQIVADELGMRPEEINVVAEMDTFTRLWSITSGSYSARFASAGTSAFAMAAKRLKSKLLSIAAHNLEVRVDDLELAEGKIYVKGSPERFITIKHVAGIAHWNQSALPSGMEPGLEATYVYNFPNAKPPDEKDRINSQNTYAFVADIVAVEIEPETGRIKIPKYVTVHDAGTIINPAIVEGQIYGSALHGLGGALYEEMVYDENGQFLNSSFVDYLCPTSVEMPNLITDHIVSPSPITVLGSKGCGESCSMTTPAALANAVADALSPLGFKVTELPLTPDKVWRALKAGK